MPDTKDIRITGAGLVGGAIASALLETLLEKNVLTLNEVRAVLERAIRIASRHSGTPAGHEALQIIGVMMADRFPEHGREK
jgi:prephenate dehydrogenase